MRNIEKEKNRREGVKLVFNSFKQVTIVSTGSIVLMVTFLDKLFKNPSLPSLIDWIFGGFVIAVLASVFSMILLGYSLFTSGNLTGFWKWFAVFMHGIAITGFLISIVLLSIFGIYNL